VSVSILDSRRPRLTWGITSRRSWNASFSECIRWRSLSLLSILRRLRSRAPRPRRCEGRRAVADGERTNDEEEEDDEEDDDDDDEDEQDGDPLTAAEGDAEFRGMPTACRPTFGCWGSCSCRGREPPVPDAFVEERPFTVSFVVEIVVGWRIVGLVRWNDRSESLLRDDDDDDDDEEEDPVVHESDGEVGNSGSDWCSCINDTYRMLEFIDTHFIQTKNKQTVIYPRSYLHHHTCMSTPVKYR